MTFDASAEPRHLVPLGSPGARRIAMFYRTFARNRGAVTGGVIVALVVLATALAPVIAPYPSTQQDFSQYLTPPSRSHLRCPLE